MPYAFLMEWSLRELGVFVAAAEAGSFTDAAIELGVSQAAVSRTIASLERTVGTRLLRRVSRGCEPTGAGSRLLPPARRVLAEADRFEELLRTRHERLRLGYAWAALGAHTATLQRSWVRENQEIELELVRHRSPTAGLAEGLCDVAVVRRDVDEKRFGSVVVGLERRLVAYADDDARWARRRRLTLAEIAGRTVAVDPRVGTTTRDLWPDGGGRPELVETSDVDVWLDTIAAGRAVGVTAEATAHHHPRPGIAYRPVTDGPRIAVRLAWWRDARPSGLTELVDAVTRLYAGGRVPAP
ncbi:LysR family transcriptional regulator [Georgenia sp. Z1491]|uniref:LysR family transcriptional regulator n=1 Tax=Georgenia sp. Z1491 TaxID=3416707 RepID=UPI003CE7CBE6